MSKKLFVGVAVICLLCANTVSVLAEQGYISVSSSVTKEVEPNLANITISVETQEKTANLASDKNKKISKNVVDEIKVKLIPNKDEIQTEKIIVRPEYTWNNNKKILKGYVAVNSITVKVRELQNIGNIMDSALKAGATKVDNFSLTLDNPNKYCTSALAEAAKDTQTKANIIAKTLGTVVIGVKSISTSCSAQSSDTSILKLSNALGSADAAASESIPVETGKIKVYAKVNASYNLK